jgi:hypothetical protein
VMDIAHELSLQIGHRGEHADRAREVGLSPSDGPCDALTRCRGEIG